MNRTTKRWPLVAAFAVFVMSGALWSAHADPQWDTLCFGVVSQNGYDTGVYTYSTMGNNRGVYTMQNFKGEGGNPSIQWESLDGVVTNWVLANGVGGFTDTNIGTGEEPQGSAATTIQRYSVEAVVCGRPGGPSGATREPIDTVNGGMYFDASDMNVPGAGFDLEWRRSYNSMSAVSAGPLGPRWSHNYDWQVMETTLVTTVQGVAVSHAGMVLAMGGDTAMSLIKDDTSQTWRTTRVRYLVVTGTTNGYDLCMPQGIFCHLGTNGLMAAVSNAWGCGLTLSYTNLAGTLQLSGVAHSDGRSLGFTYTSNRLAQVNTPSTNLALVYQYNSAGELTNAIQRIPSGDVSTFYAYDAAGTNRQHSLVMKVKANGETANYLYQTNAFGAVSGVCTGMSIVSNYYQHSVSYNTTGAASTVDYRRDSTDEVYTYCFNPASDSLCVTNIVGPGSTTLSHRFGYDPATLMLTNEHWETGTTGEWMEVRRQYDALLNVTNSCFCYGTNSSSVYSFAWNTNWTTLASMTDPEARMATWDYTNGLVRAERVFPSTNQQSETDYAYTTNGLLAAVTNANGHWVRYLYNGYGYPTSTIPQAGPTNCMVWDSLGHLTEIDLPSSEMTSVNPPQTVPRAIVFNPDELGRVRQVTWPDNSFETFGFDAIGNVTNHIDTAGRPTTYTWLPTRKLASVTRGSGNEKGTVGLNYDQQFNALKITDERTRPVETYQLDLQDRPIQVTNIDSQQMSIAWGLANFVKSIVRFDGTTNAFAYDSGGRVNQVTYPDQTVAFGYLKNGLMVTASNQWGVISNAFDGANRLISQSSPVPNGAVSYALYPAGQVSNVVSVAGTNSYALDAAERLTTVTASRKGMAAASFQYGYNPFNGAVSTVAYPTGVTCVVSYDTMDRTAALVWKNASNQVVRSRSYAYNSAGMIAQIGYETGEQVAYSYDSRDRVTGETHFNAAGQATSQETYGFDLAGNRTNKTVWSGATPLMTVNYALGSGNRLASWSVAQTNLVGQMDVAGMSSEAIGTDDRFGWLYVSNLNGVASTEPYISGTNFWAYDLTVGLGTQRIVAAIRDAAGNTTRVTNQVFLTVVTNGAYQYSLAGCVTNIAYSGKSYGSTIGLTWDGRYQLTAAATNGMVAERHGYDAAGRRLWTWDAANGTNWMVYDGPHVIADLNATGALLRAYTYGPGIDNILSMTAYGTATNTYYYLKDHLGSVIALADKNGNVVESYRYDAWGRTTVYDALGNDLVQSAYGNRYGWQGREYSWKSGLYYFRARWYSPIEGRWLSNDTIGISGGLNQFVFCGNNPVNFVDPLGRWEIDIVGAYILGGRVTFGNTGGSGWFNGQWTLGAQIVAGDGLAITISPDPTSSSKENSGDTCPRKSRTEWASHFEGEFGLGPALTGSEDLPWNGADGTYELSLGIPHTPLGASRGSEGVKIPVLSFGEAMIGGMGFTHYFGKK